MKGLLSRTSKFPGIAMMRKRHRAHNVAVRKKARKSQPLEVQKEEVHTVGEEVSENPESATVLPEAAEPMVHLANEMPISYDGDKVTVSLQPRQMVALDGWAMVRLIEGCAAVHGYSLSPGVEVLLCSSSKLAAVVAVQTPVSRGDDSRNGQSSKDERASPQVSETFRNAGGNEEAFGCKLEFQSYRGASRRAGPVFDGSDNESLERRTFKIEVAEANGRLRLQDSQSSKRKRDEKMTGGSPGGVEGEEAGASGSEDDAETEVPSSPDNSGPDHVDMDVDDSSDLENLLLFGRHKKKKLRVEPSSTAPLNAAVIPDSWWDAANSISHSYEMESPLGPTGTYSRTGNPDPEVHRSPYVAIIGPKNAGKSTFARFLLNFLLNRYEAVAYLDTDVGQPEFTVPGCLSLHVIREPIFGSPVLHLRNPERSFFYGDVSPKGDPEMYLQSVGALYDYFQQRYGTQQAPSTDGTYCSSVMPLVINTHGWIKGVGYDVLVDILRRTSPTHVVQFTAGKAEHKNLPAGRFWESARDDGCRANLLYIESALEGSDRQLFRMKMASDHLRDLRIMAYFRQCISLDPLPYPYREAKLYAQTAFALVSHTPYQVPISAVTIRHLHGQVPENESLYSLNGALVGLAITSLSTSAEAELPVAGNCFACVGIGIVRGVDADRGVLYIITPLSLDVLQEVDIILQGRVQMPVPLLQGKGYVSPYLCHHSVAIEGTGSVAMYPQKRFQKTAT